MHLLLFHQERFLSVASVVAISAFLLHSAFHYLLVYFYHKLHPSDKISIPLQDSHFLFIFSFGPLTGKESLMLLLALKDNILDVKTTGAICLQVIYLDSKPASPQYSVSTNANHSKSNHCSPRHLITGTTSVQMRTQLPSDAK